MASIFSDDAIHPGRDPNDSSWQILRRPHDWKHAKFRDAIYDPLRMVVELASLPLAAGATGPLDCAAPDGTVYRCDPDGDLVLRCGPCDPGFAPLPRFGGHGRATGRLRRPLGVALDDRGLLYVADAGNHRVQVVEPANGSVVIVLGRVDGWGDPVAGVDGGAMTEPVSVAVGPRAIYVADRGGQRIHVFDRGFRWSRSFAPGPQPPPTGFVAAPIAVAVDAAGDLLVADAGWSRLLQFAANGVQLADLGYGDAKVPASLACVAAHARFATTGEVVVCKIDGRVEDLAWHRIIVDAAIPAGTQITVQTYASDDPGAAEPFPWAPVAPVAMPDRGGAHDGTLERPVLSDVGRWQRARHGEYVRASPVIATYTGDGPDGSAPALVLAGDGLARVRAGDGIELVANAPSTAVDRVFVASVPPRIVQVSGTGVMASFGAGTQLVLVERDGVEPFAGPRALYVLATGEAIDLSAVAVDGTLAEIAVPHAAAALWRRGDVIAIGTASLLIADVRATPVTVALVGTPAGDFRSSTARIVDASGRLFVRDAVGLDAGVPADEPISIDGLTAGTAWTVASAIHWVEPELGTVWLSTSIPWADWEDFTTAAGRATDRGRYLWLRLQLRGAVAHADDAAATATPTVRSVRLLRPRPSYLRYLPATFSRRDNDDPTGALFLERMLGLFERKLTTIETRYESVTRQLDPFAADPEWLQFLAAWFDLFLDPSLSRDRRARLVAEAHALYAIRGTPEGIRRYIEIVTGESPTIVEGFQLRPTAGMVLGAGAMLGCTPLGGVDEATATSTAFLDRYAHRFAIYVFVDDPCRLEQVQASMQVLIESIRPAHTLVDLRVVVPDARVGAQSTVGVDFVLGDDRVARHVLGEQGELGQRPHPVLGLDPILSPDRGASLAVDDIGVRIDQDLSLS